MNSTMTQSKLLLTLQSPVVKLSMLCIQLLALGFVVGVFPSLLVNATSQVSTPVVVVGVLVALRAIRNFGQLIALLAK